jgi:hypothetical protein
MIDNPQKAAQLLASLKQAVPFTVTLVPTLVNYLRDQRISIAEQPSTLSQTCRMPG